MPRHSLIPIAIALLASSGCAAREVDIPLFLSLSADSISICLDDTSGVLAVDLFAYEGPDDSGGLLTGSACRRCATGEDGAVCRHLARQCICGAFTTPEELDAAFLAVRFPDVAPGNVCVRVVAATGGASPPPMTEDCTATSFCPPPTATFEAPSFCVLSTLGTVGEPPTGIELTQISCPEFDPLLDACRDDACDCTLQSVIACGMTPPGPECRLDCIPSARQGCFDGSRACLLKNSLLLNTPDCAGFSGI